MTAAGIAAIVVSYDSAETLDDCLSRLRAAQGIAEIRVVDNASRDGTLDIVQRHALADPRLRFIANPDNPGFAVACNQGAADTRAPWLAFVNPDCLVDPDSLARMRAQRHVLDGVSGLPGRRRRQVAQVHVDRQRPHGRAHGQAPAGSAGANGHCKGSAHAQAVGRAEHPRDQDEWQLDHAATSEPTAARCCLTGGSAAAGSSGVRGRAIWASPSVAKNHGAVNRRRRPVRRIRMRQARPWAVRPPAALRHCRG